MAFDVAAALNDGHSPEDIARYLGRKNEFDADQALKDGHDPFAIIKHLNAPEPQTSTAGAFGHGFVKGILPSAAGIVGGSLAAIPGAVAGPVGSFATGLAGGAAAAAGVSALQEKFLQSHPGLSKAMGLSPEQQALEEEQHPYASFIGEMAPNALALRPSGALFKSAKGLAEKEAAKLAAEKAAAIGTGAIGAGVGAGLEAGQQAMGEEPMDWKKVAIAGGMGALGQKETAIGRKLTDIGHSPFRTMQEKGGEYAKTAIKEAAEKGKPQGTEMAGYTPEEPGIYAVKVNGKEGTLEVMSDGTQKFNGQVVVEPIKVEEARPISTGQELPAALQETKPSTAKLKNIYQEPEEIMGTPDRPEATPIENTEEFPLSDEQIAEKARIEKENKENEKQLKQLAKETKKVGVAKGSDNLWNTLKNKLTPGEVSTLGGKSKTFTNRYMGLKAKGNAGTDLSTLVSNGVLDDFLPPEYRTAVTGSMNAAELGDAESAAVEYIREKILSGNYLTHNADMSIKNNGHQMEHLEEAIKKNLTTKDINELLEEAANEQRELDLSAEKPTAETQAGIAESIPTEETAPGAPKPAVSSEQAKLTPEERKKQDEEIIRKNIKDLSERAAETFELGQDPMENLVGKENLFNIPEDQKQQWGMSGSPLGVEFKKEISPKAKVSDLKPGDWIYLKGEKLIHGVEPL